MFSVQSIHRPEYFERLHELFFDGTLWTKAPLKEQANSLQLIATIVAVYVENKCGDLKVAGRAVSKFGAPAISRRFKQLLTEHIFCDGNGSSHVLQILQEFSLGNDCVLMERFVTDALHVALTKRAWGVLRNPPPEDGVDFEGFIIELGR